MERDKRVDEEIAKAAPFAQPILEHFRAVVHEAVPGAGEAIKWGMPYLTYKGKNIAGMASFKAHCAIMITGAGRQSESAKDGGGMGSYGKITALEQLPRKRELVALLRAARERIDVTGRASRRSAPPKPKAEIAVPQDFAAALREAPKAKAFFDKLAPSHRREYLQWITEAKRDETRSRRLATAIEWLGEGKRQSWKYEKS